jgi:hypothetical protein
MTKMKLSAISAAIIATLTACGGGGSYQPSAAQDTYTISGTVPGTTIEAFCDNGAYYVTQSDNNGTSEHPFTLELPAGLGCNIVMITNEDDPNDSVVTPIAFLDASDQPTTTATANVGDKIDLGHVPLFLNRSEAGGFDANGDGVIDTPENVGKPVGLKIRDYVASKTLDKDGNNILDFYDDEDSDGVPNHADADYSARATDSDADGLDDDVDVNPGNERGHTNRYEEHRDRNKDGYLDQDHDRDGYYDDDADKDGFRDGDADKDGFHDDDHDRDGFIDSENGDEVYAEIKGYIVEKDSQLQTLTVHVTKSNPREIRDRGNVYIKADSARFDEVAYENLMIDDFIEVHGQWDTVEVIAFEVEPDTPDERDAAQSTGGAGQGS